MNKFTNIDEHSYSHTEHCRNCGHPNMVHIPKGTTIDSYLKYRDCNNCGVVLRQPEYRMGGDRPTL